MIKNEIIHRYYKRNDNRWFERQNIVYIKVSSAVAEIANFCLEVDNKNEVIHSKDVVAKVTYAITLLEKANQ